MKKLLFLFLVTTGVTHPEVTIEIVSGKDGAVKILTSNPEANIKGVDYLKNYYKSTDSDLFAQSASGLCYLVGAIQFLRGTYKVLWSNTETYKKSLADFDEDAIKAMKPKELEKLLDQEDENRLERLENLKTYLNSAIWLGLGGIFYLYGNAGANKVLLDPATPRITPTPSATPVAAK